MKTASLLLGLFLVAGSLVAGSLAAEPAGQATAPAADAARPNWHTAPTLSVMTGFIYEPLSDYTIQKWMENLGDKFDADRWVKDFKEVGASHVVFYDKWIDGLVFHDTRTTGFKTRRDFLRELAAACQRGGLPLVLYFNAISDGNPEFDPWSLLDREGKPIVFGARWPTRYQTLHSPFREKCLEQVSELLSSYGPIHGLWFDIFHERLNTTSPWTARGYEQMFGEPFEKASAERLAEFQVRTLAGYLDQVDAIRRRERQDRCMFTANGSGPDFLRGGQWTDEVGSRLEYLFAEGHSFAKNEELARMAWALPKPLDINLLLVSSWFTPLDNSPPPASLSVEQAIAATAIAVCQGAGVNFALTPGHDGVFGDDLQRAKAVGSWFHRVEPWLKGAQPAAEVAVVYGPAAPAVTDALTRAGIVSRWIAPGQPLPQCRAIVVPPGSRMDGPFKGFVEQGGTLVALGDPGSAPEVFGVKIGGEIPFANTLRGATVRVDSQYDDEYAGVNALDDAPGTAWASGSTPMPHWAEITMPERAEVRSVEVASRPGAYLVTDLDIEVPQGDGWRTAASVRGATSPKIVAEFDQAVTTDRIRVKILRELYQGQDRTYADVASIRVLDAQGQNRARSAFRPVKVVGEVKGELPPAAIAAAATTARVLAQFEHPDQPPAVLENRVGKGRALLVTSTASPSDGPFWTGLWKRALGEPTLLVGPEDGRRFRFILARVDDALVLHVIDAAVPATDYRPKTVTISLAATLVPQECRATQVGSDRPLELTKKDGRVELTVEPAPVATVALQGTR
ncbi:MAG: discoidin domain-containing protein [Thermoguttaceae bacterium]